MAALVDQWYTDADSYFRVITEDGGRDFLRVHLNDGRRELVRQETQR